VGFATQCDDEVDVAKEAGSMGLVVWSLMSTPTSARDSAESRLIEIPGWVPAEYTCTESPAMVRISPAAIWDLPLFLTQTNSTDGVAVCSDIN
jgi:hypothetical protein